MAPHRPLVSVPQRVATPVRGAAAYARGLRAERIVKAAPPALATTLQPLTPSELLRLRHVAFWLPTGASLAQALALLPPLLAQKILAVRGRNLLDQLLAWGASLREQAAIAKKAQGKAHAKAVTAQRVAVHAQRLRTEHQARVARERHMDGMASGPVGPFVAGTDARRSAPRMGPQAALETPWPTGFSLRGATLRLRAAG